MPPPLFRCHTALRSGALFLRSCRLLGTGSLRHVSRQQVADAERLLGVSPPYTNAQLKRSYRDLVKQFHPDRVASDAALQATAEAKMSAINAAFDVLSFALENPHSVSSRTPAEWAAEQPRNASHHQRNAPFGSGSSDSTWSDPAGAAASAATRRYLLRARISKFFTIFSLVFFGVLLWIARADKHRPAEPSHGHAHPQTSQSAPHRVRVEPAVGAVGNASIDSPSKGRPVPASLHADRRPLRSSPSSVERREARVAQYRANNTPVSLSERMRSDWGAIEDSVAARHEIADATQMRSLRDQASAASSKGVPGISVQAAQSLLHPASSNFATPAGLPTRSNKSTPTVDVSVAGAPIASS